jgi:hypothetical protein
VTLQKAALWLSVAGSIAAVVGTISALRFQRRVLQTLPPALHSSGPPDAV